MKHLFCALTVLLLVPAAWANVTVNSPADGQTLSTSVHYSGSSTAPSCERGVTSMGVYVDNVLIYVVPVDTVNTTLTLTPGKHETVLQEWDYCGGSTFVKMHVVITSGTGVYVTSPTNSGTATSPVSFVATATASTCAQGIASMGVYVNGQLVKVQNGASLNTQLPLPSGLQNTVVQEWDYCGGSSYVPVSFAVQSTGHTLSNLQADTDWESWGQIPPGYVDCSPCSGIEWSTEHAVASPSISGNSTRFGTRGSKPYAVVPWVDPVIGTYSTQNLPDEAHTLIPSIHNFTYDTAIYITDLSVTAVLEFDVSMYMNGTGMFFGTQCNHLNGGEWDVLNNVTQQWSPTHVPCNLVNGWNHLTLQFQRTANNEVVYRTIALNGVTANVNETFPSFQVPTDWYGITVNYQMDGDKKQSPSVTYLDNLSLTYE
jgi:hypothetical protein